MDLLRGLPGEHPEVDQNIAAVPLPKNDSLYGANGPLEQVWRANQKMLTVLRITERSVVLNRPPPFVVAVNQQFQQTKGILVMITEPQIVRTDAQLTAVIPFTIPREEMRNVMGPGLSELMATIAAQGITPAGPWFDHHLKMDPDIFDFELSLPVTAPVAATGRVRPSRLPAATVARTVYLGPYEGLGDAWDEFVHWITAQGHTPAPNLWQCYLRGPESNADPSTWQTELNRPLIQ